MRRGIDYATSPEKLAFDLRCRQLLVPTARVVDKLVVRALQSHHTANTDPYFLDARMGKAGAVHHIAKIATMHSLSEHHQTDEAIGFNKNNPRIVSRRAHMIRNLGLDEIPQLYDLPRVSMVGPRLWSEEALGYFMSGAQSIDRGVARDFLELYEMPAIRHGLTGPCQLLWARTHERTPEVVTEGMKADLEYYHDEAHLATDARLIVQTPFVLLSATHHKSAPL